LAKKLKVFVGPRRTVMPRRRRILPIKMRARSKKNMRPRRRKNVPEPVKAAPISKRALAM